MLTETDASKLLKRASHPFDGSEGSDVVLRTSDKCDFYVHRIILSMASSFFKTMFSLPQPQTPKSDTTTQPVIDVPEHSNTLDPLLRICHPVEEPIITDISLLGDMLEAAMKYELTKAENLLKKRLREYAQSTPLLVYAVSCRLKLEEIATVAAHKWREIAPKVDDETIIDGNIVDWAKTTVGSSYTEEMSRMSAGSFYRLIYFVRRGTATSFCEYSATQDSNSITKSFSGTPSSGGIPSTGPTHGLYTSSNVGTAPAGAPAFSIFGTFAPLSGTSTSTGAIFNQSARSDPSTTSVPLSTTNQPLANYSLSNSAFNFSDFDLTILSSNGLSFKVHELIVRLCAPSMMSNGKLLQGLGGKKLISLEDSDRTLSILLHICYPSMTIDLGLFTMPDISLALTAAVKYGMKKAVSQLKSMLKFSSPAEALKIYFTFANSSLMDEATEVARSDILLFSPIASLYAAEMEQVSARYYYHLLQHRHACLSALLVVGSKYKNGADRQWWATMKVNSSISIRLAGPVAEKYLKSVNPSSNSANARSSIFGPAPSGDTSFNLKKLHDESVNFDKEINEVLSREDGTMKLHLTLCNLALISKQLLERREIH